jgi:serine/threonine-protein kinase
MSPEQSSDARLVDGSTDIYALGCVFYEMLAGEPPFTGPNVQTVMERHAKSPPPLLHIIRPSLPASLDGVIGRALAKAPRDRFPSAMEFVAAAAATTVQGEAEPVMNAAAMREPARKFRWPWKS